MSGFRWLSLCALPALSTLLLASDEETPAVPSGSGATSETSQRSTPAFFSWADFDGDARLDLVAVTEAGRLQLLSSVGGARFEDVTERAGLSGIVHAALALWADYDSDGRLDLFVGARAGRSMLFHNDGGVFSDVGEASGLLCEGAVQQAHWLDHDGDERLDLHVVLPGKGLLFHGIEGGFFEGTELPAAFGATAAPPLVERPAPPPSADDPASGSQSTLPGLSGTRISGSSEMPAPPPGFTGDPRGQFELFPMCTPAIQDQATSSCLSASSTPVLGSLYPLSTNLFVTVSGNVGIGTTSPTAKLHVAGTSRMTSTLTLAPAGDQALNVSTGSIYKGGALFIHTKGPIGNTALGVGALPSVTTGTNNMAGGYAALAANTSGSENTAIGVEALRSNTNGISNTAGGASALYSNTSGAFNTAGGTLALFYNTTGSGNTASGFQALYSNTSGVRNTASGFQALVFTTGSRNIGIGSYAGSNLTTGNYNIAIGNRGVAGEGATTRIGTSGQQTRAFIAGIRGVTTANANAIPVLIDSAGQLGTVSSSRRFKRDIADMGELSERLLELRPVVFRYKQEQKLPAGGELPLEYGLIAEEVAEIFPELVVYDEDGQPFTVKYHLLSSMLLNELQKLDAEHARELDELRDRVAALEARGSLAESSR